MIAQTGIVKTLKGQKRKEVFQENLTQHQNIKNLESECLSEKKIYLFTGKICDLQKTLCLKQNDYGK